jgi:glutamate carboxypeptidase
VQRVDGRIADGAKTIAARAERELEALVAVSTPSGDVQAAEEAIAVVTALLPDEAITERIKCSSPDHADDLIARVTGTGSGKILLLGHLDTVIPHDAHRAIERKGTRMYGSGTVDMKGGDALALGVLRDLAGHPDLFEEIALLLVMDEEWRKAPFAHAKRFKGFDACLCFEAGEHDRNGGELVVVKRKAAGTVQITAAGRAAHSGSKPGDGISALLALAQAAQLVAGCNDPEGPDRLTAVPTVFRSGEALNVVPAAGELLCDVRADDLKAFERVIAAIPDEIDGAKLTVTQLREWPGMDAREATAPVLERASALLGRPVMATQRGGASDASHLATVVNVTIDGLGPTGGDAHAPGEFVERKSLLGRAEVALAVAVAALGG